MNSASHALWQRALHSIPGGVNSPVRAFKAVEGDPLFLKRGQGAYVWDADDQRYIDYVASWGPLILGHAHPSVVTAVENTVRQGLTFGAPTELEVLLAEKVCALMPAIEQIRMVNSGTEATMSAIRLARGFTSRNKIIKFAGCYHGHNDALLVKAGSGMLTFSLPDSAGVPKDFIQHTLVAEFNDLDAVERLLTEDGQDIAAIIVEPIAANMNCVLPLPGFLSGLRQLCDQYGCLLIFDEVITGFRVGLGGAQAHYGVTPDLTTLGKIIGGGMPVGAFGGRKEIMQHIAPIGPVYQAGTLSGNPVAMAAGLATLEEISKPGFYPALANLTQKFLQGLQELARAAQIPLLTPSLGSLFGLFFTEQTQVTNYQQAARCNKQHFLSVFHSMLQQGVYLAPSMFEAGFISAAHTEADIQTTLNAAQKAFSTFKA